MDTSDLFIEISRTIDKHLWFVEAHLQADAQSLGLMPVKPGTDAACLWCLASARHPGLRGDRQPDVVGEQRPEASDSRSSRRAPAASSSSTKIWRASGVHAASPGPPQPGEPRRAAPRRPGRSNTRRTTSCGATVPFQRFSLSRNTTSNAARAGAGRAATQPERDRASRRRGPAGARGSGDACPRRRCSRRSPRMPATSSVSSGLPSPNGARRSSSCARSSVSAAAGTIASIIVRGRRSSSASAASAWRPNASANASSCSSAIERPAAARWPPKRSRCSAQAARPLWRSKSEIERPDPFQPSAAPATSTTGRWNRSTSREATMPITPSCQPSSQST